MNSIIIILVVVAVVIVLVQLLKSKMKKIDSLNSLIDVQVVQIAKLEEIIEKQLKIEAAYERLVASQKETINFKKEIKDEISKATTADDLTALLNEL